MFEYFKMEISVFGLSGAELAYEIDQTVYFIRSCSLKGKQSAHVELNVLFMSRWLAEVSLSQQENEASWADTKPSEQQREETTLQQTVYRCADQTGFVYAQ